MWIVAVFTALFAEARTRVALRVYVLHGAQVCRMACTSVACCIFGLHRLFDVTRVALRVYVLHGAQANMSTTERVQQHARAPTCLSPASDAATCCPEAWGERLGERAGAF